MSYLYLAPFLNLPPNLIFCCCSARSKRKHFLCTFADLQFHLLFAMRIRYHIFLNTSTQRWTTATTSRSTQASAHTNKSTVKVGTLLYDYKSAVENIIGQNFYAAIYASVLHKQTAQFRTVWYHPQKTNTTTAFFTLPHNNNTQHTRFKLSTR